VIVETWQPRPAVRSSKRSDPRAQMDLYRIGASKGMAREKGSVGSGRHVEDCLVVSVYVYNSRTTSGRMRPLTLGGSIIKRYLMVVGHIQSDERHSGDCVG
jgi:hypothetical protein